MHKLGCVPGGSAAQACTSWASFAAFRPRGLTALARLSPLVVSAILIAALAAPAAERKSPPRPDATLTATGLTFEREVRPILRAHCFDCHGSQNVRKGELDLRLRRSMVKGGESGPAIQPQHPEESYLLDRIKSGEMPPGDQKLSPKEIAVIERSEERREGKS